VGISVFDLTIPNNKEQHLPHLESLKPGLLGCSVYFCSGLTVNANGDSFRPDFDLIFTYREVPMLRKIEQLFAGFALLTLMILCAQYTEQAASAQTPSAKHAVAEQKRVAPKMTNAQKIALAMSSGPTEISKNATIMDMTDMSNAKHEQLRAGTNGWVCYASVNAPMCLDKAWQKWLEAWMSKSDLKIEGTGIGYMLRGDKGASNTDPFAKGPTPDNQWVVSPPHLMVLYQDRKMLDAFPTDPMSGGPWVMWKGSTTAHVMVPVSPTKAATMSSK
jgi:hypothetical protein